MQRVKVKKKKQEETPKFSTHFLMSVIMPCVMLACKDVFKATPNQLKKLEESTQRYINYVAEGKVSIVELREMMEVKDVSEKKKPTLQIVK